MPEPVAPISTLGLRIAFGVLRPKPAFFTLGLRIAFGVLRPKPAFSRSRAALLGLKGLVLVTLTGLMACGADDLSRPLPGLALPSSRQAEEQFQPILRRWANARTKAERAALEKQLRSFLRLFPKDGAAPAAEVLLAWVSVEKGKLEDAESLRERASTLGPGHWHDFGALVQGAVLRRRGAHKEAAALLVPLAGKFIDAYARDLVNEELIASATGAKDPGLAVKIMGIWLREVNDEERILVKKRIEEALSRLDAKSLARIFEKRREKPNTRSPSENELDGLLAQRLAEEALSQKDAELARLLLTSGGTLLRQKGDAVARLAAGAPILRVEPKTVALLLSYRTATLRQRSTEVASGVAWGLGLPGSSARLVAKDDGKDRTETDEALDDLGRQGASVILAGLGPDNGEAAAAFAMKQRISVILLARESKSPTPDVAPATESMPWVLGLPSSPEERQWTRPTEAQQKGPFKEWMSAHAEPPTFWAAAGRDAAVLAWQAIKDLPATGTEDPAEVADRRERVRKALAATEVPMWTSDTRSPQ